MEVQKVRQTPAQSTSMNENSALRIVLQPFSYESAVTCFHGGQITNFHDCLNMVPSWLTSAIFEKMVNALIDENNIRLVKMISPAMCYLLPDPAEGTVSSTCDNEHIPLWINVVKFANIAISTANPATTLINSISFISIKTLHC